MKRMKFKGFIIQISFLWVEGMALFPFVLVKNRMPGRTLLNHECIHLRQQLEMGFILFYFWYTIEYFIRYLQTRSHYQAYRRISFEREAFAKERSFSYLLTRPFWAFLKYL